MPPVFEEAMVLLPVISFASSAIGASALSGVAIGFPAGLVEDGLLYAPECCSSGPCDLDWVNYDGDGCGPPVEKVPPAGDGEPFVSIALVTPGCGWAVCALVKCGSGSVACPAVVLRPVYLELEGY